MLLHQPVDDLDPGQVALVHRPVRRLPGKGFLMQRPVRVAVEETADLVLQLANAHHRLFAESMASPIPLLADDLAREFEDLGAIELRLASVNTRWGRLSSIEGVLDGLGFRLRRCPVGQVPLDAPHFTTGQPIPTADSAAVERLLGHLPGSEHDRSVARHLATLPMRL